MNILYDISALAVWHGSNLGKRGIYRVVEETLDELVKRTDLEVCATEDPTGGRAYLCSSQKNHCDLRFRSSFATSKFSRAIDFGLNAQESILRGLGQGRSLPQRVTRRGFIELSELIDLPAAQRNRHTFSLNEVNIFHQPGRFAIPKFVRNCHRKDFVRVSTIYDFIPLQLGLKDTNVIAARQFSKILGTISKDDAVICISDYVKDEACERLGLLEGNIFVSHLAACNKLFYPSNDAEKLKILRRRLRLDESPYYLALCALDERKNIRLLLQAFSVVLNQQTDFDAKLVLAGSVSESAKQHLTLMAKDLGITSHVVISGFVADDDLACLYSGAVSFLFPSLAEGFGLPPLEAMQCGLPVISSNQTSLPEVVGDSGILLDPTDTEAWAEAIYRHLKNEDERQLLRQRGLKRAKSFSWEKSADDHLKIYETMLSRRA